MTERSAKERLQTMLSGSELQRVLIVHAHPDDEALCGGSLAAELEARGIAVSLLTCSRGEAGEIVEGAVPEGTSETELPRIRERELAGSVRALGIAQSMWLGEPPARATGAQPRQYRDSGMRWIREGLAGPADSSDASSLTAAPLGEVIADVEAAIAAANPELIVSYDDAGGYGHPDHVRAREAALTAARNRGIPFAEFTDNRDTPETLWFELSEHRAAVVAALRCHRTQLTVDEDERGLVHSGGQHQELPLDIGLRLVG